MVCRLIEGRYPNYNSVIPQDNPHKVTIDRQMLISALRRVSVFSSQASSLIKLRLSENQIQISAHIFPPKILNNLLTFSLNLIIVVTI